MDITLLVMTFCCGFFVGVSFLGSVFAYLVYRDVEKTEKAMTHGERADAVKALYETKIHDH